MGKNKKTHKFVHPDPEEAPEKTELARKHSGKKAPSKGAKRTTPNIVATDLKKSVITIMAFITLLAAFFVANNYFGLLGQIKSLF